MAETIRRVDYFYIETPDKPGEGAKVLAALREAGVDLLAFTGFPQGRRAQLDFVPRDTATFKFAARKAGLKPKLRKAGFLIQGEDRPGAIAGIEGKLAAAGINVTAIEAVASGEGRYGAMLWVKPAALRKAARALGAT